MAARCVLDTGCGCGWLGKSENMLKGLYVFRPERRSTALFVLFALCCTTGRKHINTTETAPDRIARWRQRKGVGSKHTGRSLKLSARCFHTQSGLRDCPGWSGL